VIDCGAPCIEIHTGRYAEAKNDKTVEEEFKHILNALRTGVKLGLAINAGHGLNYDNVMEIARIRQIRELNIGHAIIARAIFAGITDAVREMKRLMNKARTNW